MELKEMIDMLKLPDDKVCLVINRTTAAMVADRLEELEKQLSKQQLEWISVEDEPPTEPDRIFIVRKNSTRVNTYSYKGNKKELKNFAYWMPMPKAPATPKPKGPTFKDVFLEKFPKASVNAKGDPKTCRNLIFGKGRCDNDNCAKCWNQPYFEEEKE